MLKAPEALWRKFDKWLSTRGVPVKEQAAYRKWLRYYLDFCHKYGHLSEEPGYAGGIARQRPGLILAG
jgi:hypothetical protein